jgi:hypothetical protein
VAKLGQVTERVDKLLEQVKHCDGTAANVSQLLTDIYAQLLQTSGIDKEERRQLELLENAVRAVRDYKEADQNKLESFAIWKMWLPLCLAHFDDMDGFDGSEKVIKGVPSTHYGRESGAGGAGEEHSAVADTKPRQASASQPRLHDREAGRTKRADGVVIAGEAERSTMIFEAKRWKCPSVDKYSDKYKLASMARDDLTAGTFVSLVFGCLFLLVLTTSLLPPSGESTNFDSSCQKSNRCAYCDAAG